MKIGDLVREKTRMNREPELGLVLEADSLAKAGTAKYLVHFTDDVTPVWMAKHHLEDIGED